MCINWYTGGFVWIVFFVRVFLWSVLSSILSHIFDYIHVICYLMDSCLICNHNIFYFSYWLHNLLFVLWVHRRMYSRAFGTGIHITDEGLCLRASCLLLILLYIILFYFSNIWLIDLYRLCVCYMSVIL